MRLEPAGGNEPETVQVRFDYDGGANALGNTMLAPRKGSASSMPSCGWALRASRDRSSAVSSPSTAVRGTLSATRRTASAFIGICDRPRHRELVPLVGVVFFGWDLGDIMVLYWLESGVIAFYTVLKIAIVGKLAALVAAPFFVGHFGGFMTGHFLLIYALFLRGNSGSGLRVTLRSSRPSSLPSGRR